MFIQYRCPKHQHVILYTDFGDVPPDAVRMIVPERPKVCPECGVSYYKWQCLPDGASDAIEG